MHLYHLHPIAVHFPIALLSAGFLAEILSLTLKEESRGWWSTASQRLLWLGTLSLWIALGFGLLAEETAPHVPPAWEVVEEHETLGFITAGIFSALSIVRFYFRGRWGVFRKTWRVVFAMAWLVSAAVLFATGFYGGKLVFEYGMGVELR